MKGVFRKKGDGLYPAGAAEDRIMQRIPDGSLVSVEVVRPRSQARHRFFWSMVGWLVEQISHDEYNKETVADILKVTCGHYTYLLSPSGIPYRLPRSIAFHELSEDEFAELTDKITRGAAVMLERLGQKYWTAERVERCRKEFDATWG